MAASILIYGKAPTCPLSSLMATAAKVDINQTQQKAILTWDTFNVGAKTDLNFNQHGNRDWVALNRVLDPNARRARSSATSRLTVRSMSSTTNGIIFGGTAQVNVGALIASTANISNDQFRNSGIYSTQARHDLRTPSFTDGAAGSVNGSEAGACRGSSRPADRNQPAVIVTAGGGFVLLMGGPRSSMPVRSRRRTGRRHAGRRRRLRAAAWLRHRCQSLPRPRVVTRSPPARWNGSGGGTSRGGGQCRQ